MTDHFTGKDILDTLTAAHIPAVWEWTGGPCRAVLAMTEEGTDGPRVRITDEWDPFTDHDFDHDVSGALLVGLYTGDEDEEGVMHNVAAATPSDLLPIVAGLLHTQD